MDAVFIGAGNVAEHLSAAMQGAGFQIAQIYSRSEEGARKLAGQRSCDWTTDLRRIVDDAGLYVFAVSDHALPKLIPQLRTNSDALWIHTAGSVPADVFRGYVARYGVLYPLQTFSKGRDVAFRHVPCFVEGAWPEDEMLLLDMAGRLSDNVCPLSSEKRKFLHLAAVFACNFTNHLYLMAGRIVQEQGLSPDILLPLIDETAAKIHAMPAGHAQTGPARRGDRKSMNLHLSMLDEPVQREIYRLISDNIYNLSKR
ncbi:MAG: DUF2520 domain-containing protein [Tannerella sp.]|nr:DUF2520 domain-containing protein [Tannerella sp.]